MKKRGGKRKGAGRKPMGKERYTVTLTAAALDPVTRTMRTEIHVPNRKGLLKSQMSGTATVVLEEPIARMW